MSFKIIDGGGPNKEDRQREQKRLEQERDREWAEDEFSHALRNCAANVLRIVRGAGKPYELVQQMNEVVAKAVKYREGHGYYPSSDLIQSELALHDEFERRDRAASVRHQEQDGELDRLFALRVIHRGALQVAASGLIGQDTQQRAGESELHRGMTMWRDWLEERDRRRREAARPPQNRSKTQSRLPGGTGTQGRKLQSKGSEMPDSASPSTERSRARKQAGFSQGDLKELRRAIKTKDSKKIAELTARIGRPPSCE